MSGVKRQFINSGNETKEDLEIEGQNYSKLSEFVIRFLIKNDHFCLSLIKKKHHISEYLM